jgi:hypothetical protein
MMPLWWRLQLLLTAEACSLQDPLTGSSLITLLKLKHTPC